MAIDERWLEWLDNRISLLINRDGIDVRDYGGKRYEEYVSVFSSIAHMVFLTDDCYTVSYQRPSNHTSNKKTKVNSDARLALNFSKHRLSLRNIS